MPRLLAALLTLAAFAHLPAASAQQKGRKVAFLVGVSTYKNGLADLGGIPNNDVGKLGEILGKNGFAVQTLTGEKATKKEILARFRAAFDGGGDSDKALGRGDIVLVQLCMHGFTLEANGKKEPFLAGHDGKADEPATLVGLTDLIRTAAPFGASTFFLVDACREVTDANRGVEGAPMALPKNTAVLFSCAQGQLAYQPDSIQHGLFTYGVLKALRGDTGLDGDVTWADLVSHVGKAFRTNEFKKLIRAGKPQTPLAIQGETEDKELFSTRAVARPAPTKEDRAELLSDHTQCADAFMRAGDHLDHCLRTLVPERAVAWKAASDAGDPTAHALYALCLMNGIGHPQDEKLSLALLEKAAAKGDHWAMTGVAFLYYTGGDDVVQDYAKALDWYQKAAAKGNALAMNTIGVMAASGFGVKQDDAQAVKWFLASANGKCPIAMYSLGRHYQDGDGVQQNFKTAFEWYKKGAEAGSEEAMHRLALMYTNGLGVAKNDTAAVEWLRLARDQRYAPSINQLGIMYAEGRGVAKNVKTAATLYLRAAEKGFAPGQTNLGEAYLEGAGVPQDDKKAYALFRKAAKAKDPEGLYYLGFMYENGRGTEQNYRFAMIHYQDAAKAGSAPAMYSVGSMYAGGFGVVKNDTEALKWYRKGADGGNTAAMNATGFMYEMGRGVPKDDKLAFDWYTKAADKGNAVAQYNLADLYEYGHGVARDGAKAFALYTTSAAQGNTAAMYRLARCHENGVGTRTDLTEARKWYKKAADEGDKDAKKALERLGK